MKTSAKGIHSEKRLYHALATLTLVVLTVFAFGQNRQQLTNNVDLPQYDIVHSDANKQSVEDPNGHPLKNPIHIMDGVSNNGTGISGNTNSESSAMAAPGENRLRGKSVLDGVAVESFHNYPDPFVEYTTIEYEVLRPAYVHLRITYRGQLVKIVASDFHEAGRYRVTFQAEGMPPGDYDAALTVNGQDVYNSMYKIK